MHALSLHAVRTTPYNLGSCTYYLTQKLEIFDHPTLYNTVAFLETTPINKPYAIFLATYQINHRSTMHGIALHNITCVALIPSRYMYIYILFIFYISSFRPIKLSYFLIDEIGISHSDSVG